MNWLTNVVRPKIRSILRRETPENLWIKCPDSGQLVFYKDVEANQFVIPGSNYHMRMGAVARLKSIFDNETWFDVALPEVTADPLKFRDDPKYPTRITNARATTCLNHAVTASYAMLGDVQIAEAGALIGFAGARVIEQTIREKLPEGFQRAEYLKDHGMVDMVVHRHDLRPTLARLCRLLTKSPAIETASKPAPQVTIPAQIVSAADVAPAGPHP